MQQWLTAYRPSDDPLPHAPPREPATGWERESNRSRAASASSTQCQRSQKWLRDLRVLKPNCRPVAQMQSRRNFKDFTTIPSISKALSGIVASIGAKLVRLLHYARIGNKSFVPGWAKQPREKANSLAVVLYPQLILFYHFPQALFELTQDER